MNAPHHNLEAILAKPCPCLTPSEEHTYGLHVYDPPLRMAGRELGSKGPGMAQGGEAAGAVPMEGVEPK